MKKLQDRVDKTRTQLDEIYPRFDAERLKEEAAATQ